MRRVRSQFLAVVWVALVACLMCGAVLPATGEAQTGARASLLTFGTETGALGGQVGFGAGVAVDRVGVGGGAAGEVYVANFNNRRVEVFSGLGVFSRAFGFDVVASGEHNTGADEQQTVTLAPSVTGGTFTLRWPAAANATAAIPFNATPGAVQAALEAVSTVGAGNVSVSSPNAGGGAAPGGPYTVTFQGSLGGNDQAQMTSASSLTGGGVTIATTVGGGGVEVCQAASSPADTCSIGSDAGVAGVVGRAEGLGFDQATGNVFVADQQNRRIVVYKADGTFQGAFGWNVNASAPAAQLQFCTSATGCQQGTSTANGGGFAALTHTAFAVDPSNGHLYVAERGNRRVNEFALTLDGDDDVTGVSFVRAFGWDVVASGPGTRTFSRSERQQVALSGTFDFGCFCAPPITGGSFTLSFDPDGAGPSPVETTGGIPFDATAATVEQRLVDDLPSIAVGDVVVAGGPGPDSAWTVDFAGAYADTDVAQMTGSAAGLTPGGNVTVTTPVAGGEFPAYEVCRPSDGDVCKAGTAGTAGTEDGQFPNNTPTGIAIDEDGLIYVASSTRIQVFNPDATFKQNFGPSTGDCPVNGSSVSGVTVDPANQHVFVTHKPTTTSYRLCEFLPNGTLVDASPTTPITTNASGYLHIARGPNDRTYVNTPLAGAGGPTAIHLIGSPPPPPGVVMDAVDGGSITTTTATLEGTVTVPSSAVPAETVYHFEYSTNGATWTNAPDTDVSVGSTPGAVDVSLDVKGLAPNTLYLARLVAKTTSTVSSNIVTFQTGALPPSIELTFPDDVTQTTATLGAQVHPHNLPTTYHFEWGTSPCSNVPNPCAEIPAFERQLGAGGNTLIAKETIGDLDPASEYHFRIVATNSEGTTTGPDQPLQTLNSCGLIDNRCFELVSPADKGPVAQVGRPLSVPNIDPLFQALDQGGEIAYLMSSGLPDATAGEDVVYRALRGSSGWSSEQLSVPAIEPDQSAGAGAQTSLIAAIASDLSCAVVMSPMKLTPDTPESAGVNLFVRDAGGQYTRITTRPPVNQLGGAGLTPLTYNVLGVSSDCSRVIFRSSYHFLGVPHSAGRQIYEWHEGTLSNVAMVPGSSEPVEAMPGALREVAGASPGTDNETNVWRAVSSDASRVVFTAKRVTAEGAGQLAVFSRDDGATAVDVSLSETSGGGGPVNDGPSSYQIASTDGNRVVFIARPGLASNSPAVAPSTCSTAFENGSGAGTTLQVYDMARPVGERLTDLSAEITDPDQALKGASVAGALGASDDASHVYFAARGQLAGEGRAAAENEDADTYNIYLAYVDETGLETKFVGMLAEDDVLRANAAQVSKLVSSEGVWDAHVTRSGRHLLFSTAANVTGYESGGAKMVYRYSDSSGETVCVSCPRDGSPSVASAARNPLVGPRHVSALSPREPLRMLADDGNTAFFYSRDKLATGGVPGNRNLYQWTKGQVSLLAVEPLGLKGEASEGAKFFAGASVDGSDVYFATPVSLTTEDRDGQPDLYDARVGGGFAPSPEPAPCDPLAGQCQSAGQAPGTPALESVLPGDANAVQAPRSVFRVGAVTRAQRAALVSGRRARLSVKVNGAGKVSVKGVAMIRGFRTTVISASRTVERAGRVSLSIRLSKAARSWIRSTGRLRVSLSTRFSGTRRNVVRSVAFTKPKKKSGRRAAVPVSATGKGR